MNKLLLYVPVQILEVGSDDTGRGVHVLGLDIDTESDIVASIVRIFQVVKRNRISLRSGGGCALERLKSHWSDDPRADGCGPVLCTEGTEGDILPL